MPFSEIELQPILQDVGSDKRKFYFEMANIFLKKAGENRKTEVRKFVEEATSYSVFSERDIINTIEDEAKQKFKLFKMPDELWRLVQDAPREAFAPKNEGLAKAPPLPTELKETFVLAPSQEQLLLDNGYEFVGRRGTSDKYLAVLKSKGFSSLVEAGCGVNGKVRGEGVYIGVGASLQDAKNWCKEEEGATQAVVLKIYARMKHAKGKTKPMAAYYGWKREREREQIQQFISHLDQKYDYVQGDIQGKPSLTEIKFGPEAAKDLRMILEFCGAFSDYSRF